MDSCQQCHSWIILNVSQRPEVNLKNPTDGASILFPLHLLAVLLQLLVCQLVKGVWRFWFRWNFRWTDWRLMDTVWFIFKQQLKEEPSGLKRDCSLPEDYRQLKRWRGLETGALPSSCPDDSAVGSEDQNGTFPVCCWVNEVFYIKLTTTTKKKLPCSLSQSLLEGWWKEAQTGLDFLSWWLCCLLGSSLLFSATDE